jgi:branched-chain amino acid transport system substrate-binding protein
MNFSRKALLISLVAILNISILFMFTGCKKKEPAAKETFRIGMAAPLSGSAALLGEGMKNALYLAKENLRKDTKYNYEVVVEDDQLDPKLTANAANKLINIDKVDAIFTIESEPGSVVAHLAKQYNILHFGITAVSSVADGVNTFLHWTPAVEQAKLVVRELRKRGYKRVGIFRSTSLEDWKAYADAVRKLAEGTDIQIVTEQTFTDDQKDFRSYIAKAKRASPDIYFLVLATPAIEMLTKQMKETGIKTPMTSIEAFEDSEQPELFEGYWYVNAVQPNSEYTDSYENKYHKNPYLCSGNVYDMFNLVVTAIENVQSSKKPTTQEIVAELKKLKNFPGALGNLAVGDDGVVISRAQLKTIKNGKATPLED